MKGGRAYTKEGQASMGERNKEILYNSCPRNFILEKCINENLVRYANGCDETGKSSL